MDCSVLGKALRFFKVMSVMYCEHSTPKMTIYTLYFEWFPPCHFKASTLTYILRNHTYRSLPHVWTQSNTKAYTHHRFILPDLRTQVPLHDLSPNDTAFCDPCPKLVLKSYLTYIHPWHYLWRLTSTSDIPSDFYFAILTSFLPLYLT